MREGGKLGVPWWINAAAEKQLKVMVEVLFVAARLRRRQESVRRGESEGKGWRGRARTEMGKVEDSNICMLGQRQMMPRWDDYPVRRQDIYWWRGCQDRTRIPPI